LIRVAVVSLTVALRIDEAKRRRVGKMNAPFVGDVT
jgi:hypothetical protein